MKHHQRKVAMYLPFVFPSYGGTELATYNLSKELIAQEKCDVRLWAFSKKGSHRKSIFTKGTSHFINQFEDVPLFTYFPVNLPRVKDFSMKMLVDLRKSNAEILHFQSTARVLSRFLLERIAKKKIMVLTTHGLQESVLIAGHGGNRFFVNFFLLDSLKHVDHIIALSKTDVHTLLSLGIKQENISLIPNGIDEKKFEKRRKYVNTNNKLKILSVARFDSNKNHEALIYMIEKLARHFDLEAYFVGAVADRYYFNKIIQLIEKRNLHDVIKIGLSLDDEALVDCYLSCDLFVLPSTIETSPLAILEAMYAGMPILSTHVGGIPDLVKNGVNGFLVPPDNIEQLYIHAKQLFENTRMRNELATRNRKVARNYTWGKIALRTSCLYTQLVEES